ncbi:hypothetical protein EDB86DRAFT_1965444 [Lactarius hatsudake]|nr:hypothetical protein EDB86DRAFT_1965444 [Lactarius hatsudake]
MSLYLKTTSTTVSTVQESGVYQGSLGTDISSKVPAARFHVAPSCEAAESRSMITSSAHFHLSKYGRIFICCPTAHLFLQCAKNKNGKQRLCDSLFVKMVEPLHGSDVDRQFEHFFHLSHTAVAGVLITCSSELQVRATHQVQVEPHRHTLEFRNSTTI